MHPCLPSSGATPVGRHQRLTRQDELELSQAYEAGLPGLTIAGAAA
jgi:hypothetical protein